MGSTPDCSIFTAWAYARAVLGVVILSVRPSVTRVLCDKTKQWTVDPKGGPKSDFKKQYSISIE